MADSLFRALNLDANDRVQTWVTDSEEALKGTENSPLFQAPSFHILCELHLRQNTLMSFLGCHGEREDAKKVLNQIYGCEVIDNFGLRTRKQGAVDSVSEKKFYEYVEKQREEWDSKAPGFTDVFLSTQGRRIVQGYILPKRVFSGLGPSRVTTNVSECTNKYLKEFLGNNQKKSLDEVIVRLEQIFTAKFVDIGQAIFGSANDIRLAPNYASFRRSPEKWNTLSADERTILLNKIGIFSEECQATLSNRSYPKIELPPLIRVLYTEKERVSLFDFARELFNSGKIVQHGNGSTYAIDTGSSFLRLEVQRNGKITCNCIQRVFKKPVCIHNLALSFIVGKTCEFFQVLEEERSSLSISDVRAMDVTETQGKKPTRRGRPQSAREQNRSVSQYVFVESDLETEKRVSVQKKIAAESANRISGKQLKISREDMWKNREKQNDPTNGSVHNFPGRADHAYRPTAQQLHHVMLPAEEYMFSQEYHNEQPFRLIFLRDMLSFSRQRSCVSCGAAFAAKATEPHDICFLHMERFQIDEVYTRKKLQQRYIHARYTCILSRYPYFNVPDFLQIEDAVYSFLSPLHFGLLKEQFGFVRH